MSLDELVAAGPWPERAGLRIMLALGRRPRGLALLRRVAGADQAATALGAMAYYDEPALARALGWDAAAVVARGRQLRRTEGRP